MKACVVGATGFLGRRIVARLDSREQQVVEVGTALPNTEVEEVVDPTKHVPLPTGAVVLGTSPGLKALGNFQRNFSIRGMT